MDDWLAVWMEGSEVRGSVLCVEQLPTLTIEWLNNEWTDGWMTGLLFGWMAQRRGR